MKVAPKSKSFRWFAIAALLLSMTLENGCVPEYVNSSSALTFSTDTLMLDTLIVGLTSETRSGLKLYNNGKHNVDQIRLRLAGGEASPFKINVNGLSQAQFESIRLQANDSLYIFVQANIADAPMPDVFVPITDSIIVESGTHRYSAVLHIMAINATVVEGTLTDLEWEEGQHIFIKKDAVVPANSTLTIHQGTTVYLNNNTGLVVEGNINALGSLGSPIVFTGARQGKMLSDLPYSFVPGRWNSIWLKPNGSNHIFNYCEIKNAKMGIVAGEPGSGTKTDLTVTNSTFSYNSTYGILGYNSNINIANSLLSNSPQQLVMIGGSIKAVHCTMANYFEWQSSFDNASAVISNYNPIDEDDQTVYTIDSCLFVNCILTGPSINQVDVLTKQETVTHCYFWNCLLKTTNNIDPAYYSNNIINEEPDFKSRTSFEYNYLLTEHSPCIDKGHEGFLSDYPADINGTPRAGIPDIGAFEYTVPAE